MSTFDDLKTAVRQYCSRYHILPFDIREPYDLSSQWKTTSFPYAKRAGCYAMFDDSGALL